MTAWLDALEAAAPDPVAAFRGIEAGAFIAVRREVRRRAGAGTAEAVVAQLAAIAEALTTLVDALPEAAFAEPGGEADWTVAEAIGHDADARAGLAMAAALAAQDRWPADAGPVVPSVPGDKGVSRDDLRRRIATSQRLIARSARSIAGHETDPCPLEHPLVGKLRCGEWLLFAGVHDLMHLEQLHGIADRHGLEPAARSAARPG
jgi:hypothetical protein